MGRCIEEVVDLVRRGIQGGNGGKGSGRLDCEGVGLTSSELGVVHALGG